MQFFNTLIGSFHSATTYRQVRKTANYGMGYSLLLVMLCTLAVTVYYGQIFHREVFAERDGKPALFDDLVSQIAQQIPVMTFSGNRLSTQTQEATTVRVSGEAFGEKFEQFALITIDTTGSSTHANMKTPVLITADDFIIKTDDETKIQPLSKFEESGTVVINRAMAEDMGRSVIEGMHDALTQFYIILGGMAWICLIIAFYILRICMIFALGLGGLAIGSILKSPINYAASVSLAAVSFTPVALLDTAMFIGAGYSLQTITLLFAGLAALTAAIACSREPKMIT